MLPSPLSSLPRLERRKLEREEEEKQEHRAAQSAMGCLWSKKTVEEGEEQERLIGGTGIEARARYGGNSTPAERVPFPSNDAAPPTPKRETEVKQSQQEKASDAQERKPVTRKLSFQETDKGAGVIQAGKLTGQALLQVAQNVPILAPVAFLLGAVSQSANEAVMLKADCNAFRCVTSKIFREFFCFFLLTSYCSIALSCFPRRVQYLD